MNGLFTTLVPSSDACLRYARYNRTSCEIRSIITAYSPGTPIRVMSSDTYSATTPVWRRFTSSMKAGGNDHSRPTRRPIFCSIGCVLRGWLEELNAPLAAVHVVADATVGAGIREYFGISMAVLTCAHYCFGIKIGADMSKLPLGSQNTP